MIWLRDVRRIQHFLDIMEESIELPFAVEDLSVPFLDWLHDQVMKSKFAEPQAVINGLKDARNTIIFYQDEGHLPFEFTPDESKERDVFIIDKTLEYLKANLTQKKKEAANRSIPKQDTGPLNSTLNQSVKSTGRGPGWYYPSSWEGK